MFETYVPLFFIKGSLVFGLSDLIATPICSLSKNDVDSGYSNNVIIYRGSNS